MQHGNHKCLLSPRVEPNPSSVFNEENGTFTDLLTQIEIVGILLEVLFQLIPIIGLL